MPAAPIACLEPLSEAEMKDLEEEGFQGPDGEVAAAQAANCSSADDCLRLGEQHLKFSVFSTAPVLVLLEKAITLDPTNGEVNKALASAYHNRHGCLNIAFTESESCRAETACRMAISQTPNDPDGYLLLGDILSAEIYSEYRDADNAAVDTYEKAISLRPQWADAYCHLANAYRLIERYEDAISAYKSEADIRSQSERPVQHKAWPGNIEPWKSHDASDDFVVAEMDNKIGRYQQALGSLKHAASLNPEDATIQLQIGETYLKMGDIESAGLVERALATDCPVKDKNLVYQCDAFSKSLAEAIERAKASPVPDR